jgi:hypothetical protein
VSLARPEVRASFLLLLSAREAAALSGREGQVALPAGVLSQAGLSQAQLASLCRRGWLREAGGGYVLTEEGADRARPAPLKGEARRRPCWDRSRGELRLGGVVVKRLPATATAQIAVLEAFQAAGWAAEIDAVLEGEKARQPKLREAVRNLNRSRQARALTFWLRRGRLGWSASQTS